MCKFANAIHYIVLTKFSFCCFRAMAYVKLSSGIATGRGGGQTGATVPQPSAGSILRSAQIIIITGVRGVATSTIDLIQMDILICAKKITATRTSSGLKIWRNALAAGALPRARWGSLQRSPRPLAGFWEGKWGKEKEGKKCQKSSRDRGGGTKRGEGVGGREEEWTLLISFAPNLWTLATPLKLSAVLSI